MRRLYVLILLSLSCHTVYAQNSDVVKKQSDVLMFSKATDEGLALRWAPSNSSAWQKGNKYGYTIERITIDGSDNKEYSKVGEGAFKPWPKEKWEPIVNDEHPYVAAAAMSIFGEVAPVVSFVQADRDLNNRYGFALLSADLDKLAAEASGLYYVDKDAKRNTLSVYRIYMINELNESVSDTSYHLLNFGETIPFLAPQLSDPIETEHTITLRWLKVSGEAENTGYYIERSDDNGKSFQRVNKTPYVGMSTNAMPIADIMSYSDSVPQNYKPYQYRIIALDAFGDQSAPSEAIVTMARDKTAPTPAEKLTTSETEEHFIKIEWEYKPSETDFKGFKIYRSINDEPYRAISNSLSADVRSFVDQEPDGRETNMYKVVTVDTAGNESSSPEKFGITTDQTPPEPPTNLRYNIDSNGVVLIEWDAPKDKDLRGYLIHFNNDQESEFAVKPGKYLTNTHFIEKLFLNSLSEEVYYYVIAIDLSYNASKASDILTVKKPDRIPPTASIFSNYYVSEEGISIEWNRSASSDVEKIELQRRSANSDWSALKEFDQNKNTFIDKSVIEGVAYEYNLWTYDDDGNLTINEKTLSLTALKSFYLKETPIILGEMTKEGISLSVSYSNLQDMEFRIYRSVNGGDFKTYTLLSKQSVYLDTSFTKKQTYKYTVVAIATDG